MVENKKWQWLKESNTSRHTRLALIRRVTSSIGTHSMCSFRTKNQGVVPCTHVPQAHLVGTHSLHPSNVSATPSLQLPRAKHGRSSSSRPTETCHRSRCCHDMARLEPMTLCYMGRGLDHFTFYCNM